MASAAVHSCGCKPHLRALATWGLWLILPLGFLSLLAQGLLAHPPTGERPGETIARVRTREEA